MGSVVNTYYIKPRALLLSREDLGLDSITQTLRIPLTAHIRRDNLRLAPRQDDLDGAEHGVGGVLVAEVLQHHLAGPDHADGVGDALAGDVGGAAVDGLEQAGEAAVRVDVARGRDADGTGAGGAQVRQDVAEQVAADDHVEHIRALHEVRRQDVDVVLVDGDARVGARHLAHARVPVRHRDADAVALGRAREPLPRPALRQLEGVPQHPVHARPRHDRLLDHRLPLRPLEDLAPDAAVLALRVLAHDPEVNVSGLPAGHF